ncbi:MAG: carbohydrate binding domain-containing protein, partial [Lachnospiraceae bacterium]|nr:carbohydrate binding domain-containing protein [Lachnospiraceae bacterium]
NNKVTWKSSDAKVVSVSKGKLTGKKAGTATVTMTANGVTDTVQVIVQDYTPTIALNQKEYTLYTKGGGNSIALKATVNGASKKVQWQSNNTSVAEVKNGKVVAKAKGKALITATANDVTAKCWISVKEPKIILERNALVIKPTDKVNLCDYASIEVVGAKQSVTYKSSDAKTVTVDKKGNVTGKKVGNATITVKANGVEEICDVTVSDCETHVWVDATDEKYEKFNRSATCEETGLSCKECSVCHGKEQIVTPPLGHSFGKWTVVAWSTENAAGLERQVCTRCKEENTRIIPAKNKGDLAYGYKLAWEDNFNGAELDRSSWNVELHEPGWVNAELQEYVDSEKNIYVKDGNLVIQAIKDGNNYTSGRVNTQNKHDYQYGRFEARAKVPSGQGFLPAFWMMPTDEMYYGQWPLCGEIDIMEVMGQETNKAYSTLHFGQPHTQKQGSYTLAEGETDFSEDFHVYACEWDPDEFRFYVDDKLFYKVNDWFTKRQGYPETAYPAPYDQPFYMILNLAVGGSWVGYPDETTAFEDNAQLVVDYVRVYQKDEYERNISKPGTDIQLRDPDETGNYIINGDFAKPEDLSKKEDDQENWKLHLEKGGAATAENSDEVLNITPTAAGTENHSVQIVQANLPIEKGCSYKLSYEAYADAERTMITDVSAPDRGYIRYLADTKVTLTTTLQNFEHTFEMTSDSDANGRVEFNLGNQDSIAAVHIDNVRLQKLGVVEEEEEVKGVLPDGNYVYNGSFNEGNLPGRLRLDYWDWKAAKGASVSVTDDSVRELKVVVPETVSALEDVAVYQKPIAITGGNKYKLSFVAHADQAKTIKTTIAGMTFESALTADQQKYTYELETAEGLDGSELRFLLGAPGITYIDNVSIRKVGADTGLIVNGDFSSALEGFDPYVDSTASATYVVDSLKEKDAFSIDITDTGDAAWKIQLKQNNIKLEKDKWYKLDFDAKSTMNRKIMYALQRDGSSDDNWTPYSGEHVIDLTNEYQTFSHTFKMANDTDPKTVLSISMGAVGGTQITEKHTVVIDNIKLVETDPVEIPPVVEGKEMIANGDFSEGEAHWEKVVLETGEAEAEFTDGENGKATYKITNVGTEDWHIQLKHKEKLTLEKGAEYAVKFNIKSTEARTVKYAFMGTGDKWYGGEDLALEAGAVKEVNSTVKITEDTSNQITFQISMGQIYDHWDASIRKPIPTPTSTIEIDDISVKKIGGSGEEEPVEPVEIGTELIKNGDFSKGKEDWTESGIYIDGKGTESFEGEKAAYTITNVGTEDWHVQLKQTGLTLEQDAKYKLSFKIKSTAARNVIYKLQDPDHDYADYGSETISLEANTEKTVEKEITVDKASSKSIIFVVAMGKTGDGDESLPEHTIEIDDVSLVKVGEADDEPVEIDTELIKNGDFAEGKTNWGDYIHS